MRSPVSTPDRHARLGLAMVVAAAVAMFVWLVATLFIAAFAAP